MSREYDHLDAEKDEITLKELGENIQVLSERFDTFAQTREKDIQSIEKMQKQLDLINRDLDHPRLHSGHSTTRKIATEALSKARLETRFDELGKHEVIKDIYTTLQTGINKREKGFSQMQRQLDAIPNPKNMNTLLKESYDFRDLHKKVDALEEERDKCYKVRYNLYNEINEIKETYNGHAHPTGPQFDELKQQYEKLAHKHDCVVAYVIGFTAGKNEDKTQHLLNDYLSSLNKRIEEHENDERTLG